MPREDRHRTAYHHGDLPRVLMAEAIALLNERGYEGFSVREVARRARVAPGAPSHHFGNATGLVTAVATEGFKQLATRSQRILRQDRSPVDRAALMSEAYVKFGRQQPGIFSVMFRSEVLDLDDTDFLDARSQSFELLRTSVRDAICADVTEERVEWLAKALWAMVHGMVTLRLEGEEPLSGRVSLATRALLAGSDALA